MQWLLDQFQLTLVLPDRLPFDYNSSACISTLTLELAAYCSPLYCVFFTSRVCRWHRNQEGGIAGSEPLWSLRQQVNLVNTKYLVAKINNMGNNNSFTSRKWQRCGNVWGSSNNILGSQLLSKQPIKAVLTLYHNIGFIYYEFYILVLFFFLLHLLVVYLKVRCLSTHYIL